MVYTVINIFVINNIYYCPTIQAGIGCKIFSYCHATHVVVAADKMEIVFCRRLGIKGVYISVITRPLRRCLYGKTAKQHPQGHY